MRSDAFRMIARAPAATVNRGLRSGSPLCRRGWPEPRCDSRGHSGLRPVARFGYSVRAPSLAASRTKLASRFACGSKRVRLPNRSGTAFRTTGVENISGLARRESVVVNPAFTAVADASPLETLESGPESLEPMGVGLKIESAATFRTPGKIVSAISSFGYDSLGRSSKPRICPNSCSSTVSRSKPFGLTISPLQNSESSFGVGSMNQPAQFPSREISTTPASSNPR